MCTVTYIPQPGGCLLTSNRDEKLSRGLALPPGIHHGSTGRSLFPTDPDAGGTWIVLQETGNAAVLLNGAFVKHTPERPYVKSRGVVLLELMDNQHPAASFLQYDLSGIEPFTMVLYTTTLQVCRWDGMTKFSTQLPVDQPHIWSSVTLYDPAVTQQREAWFKRFLQQYPQITQEDILQFHRFAGEGDPENDINMNRNGLLQTVSITSIQLQEDRSVMTYLDLLKEKTTHHPFNDDHHLASVAPDKLYR